MDITWYLKQLFPLTYISQYRDNKGRWLCIWKMWLGRCYNAKYFKLASD